MDNQERKHLDEMLRILRQKFNVLEEKIARFGLDAPAYLLIEREDVKVEIARTEQKLQVQVSNPPPRPPESSWVLPIGATPDAHGTRFCVWATNARRVQVVLYADDHTPSPTAHELKRQHNGYFEGYIRGVLPGTRYKYRIDERDAYPDPASRYQPDGVHGPSQVVDPTVFDWTDQDWRGITLEDLVIYELHVGTATPEGTFDALITRLGAIRELGATAIELMPVADFPGERNWGYDGVCLFAPARAYGGPEGLRRLVDAAHARGLAVILDAVFNHLGPEGNYLRKFSNDYFISPDDFKTPWGEALAFEGKPSRPVRDFFVWNARYWAHEYHIDGLRLDAIQAMRDGTEPHILKEITTRARQHLPQNRSFLILAEDENNDPKVVESPHEGGFGVDGLWADDFHHQVHVALTGEQHSYYKDYTGSIADLVATLHQGWFYIGDESAHLGRKRGEPAIHIPPRQFIYCIQNHDQVGNRPFGDRLNQNIFLDAYRAASALLVLSPYTPLIWMGQEWAASTPFLFFTDRNLEPNQSVDEDRRNELASNPAFANDAIPKAQDRTTFLRSKLAWNERTQAPHAGVFRLYRDLIQLRRQLPALKRRERETFAVMAVGEHALALRREGSEQKDTLLVVVNLRNHLRLNLHRLHDTSPPYGFTWTRLLDTEDTKYGGRGDTQLIDGTTVEMSGPGALLLALSSQ